MENDHDKTIGVFNYKEDLIKSSKKSEENTTSSEKTSKDTILDTNNQELHSTKGPQSTELSSSSKPSTSNEASFSESTDLNKYSSLKDNDNLNGQDTFDKTTNIYGTKDNLDATINIYNRQAEKPNVDQPRAKTGNSTEKPEESGPNLTFGNSSQDKDIIRNIEVEQSELRYNNKLLIDIGDGQKISLAIPENIDSAKQIVLKGLGNTINNQVGDLILNITIIDDVGKSYYDTEKINYDYILFATPEEKNNEVVKILKLQNKKILISLNKNLENLEIIKIKKDNKIKRVLLVLINDSLEADKFNKQTYQSKIKLSAKDNKNIIKKYVKYQKNYHLIDIPNCPKSQYFCLSNTKKPFKILVVKTSIKTTILNILKGCFALFLIIGGFFTCYIPGVIFGLIITFLMYSISNKYD